MPVVLTLCEERQLRMNIFVSCVKCHTAMRRRNLNKHRRQKECRPWISRSRSEKVAQA